jgi:hypothetical protein
MFLHSYSHYLHPISTSSLSSLSSYHQIFTYKDTSITKLFPQVHPVHRGIKIIYHYGERFYSASAVDTLLKKYEEAGSNNPTVPTDTITDIQTDIQTDTETTKLPVENSHSIISASESPRSIISDSSDRKHTTTGSRCIGKRNQQFYLPDGYVKLMHVSVDPSTETDYESSNIWYGRYEKDKNIIVRTNIEYDLPDSVDISEYETLAHFAQEHDKECCGSEYIPSNTHNVWKNPHYMFYNTVTLKWEPLSRLR